MGPKLYVGDLPYSAAEQSLTELSSATGADEVNETKPLTKRPGGGRGGFGGGGRW